MDIQVYLVKGYLGYPGLFNKRISRISKVIKEKDIYNRCPSFSKRDINIDLQVYRIQGYLGYPSLSNKDIYRFISLSNTRITRISKFI